jgi:rfaE bifunctional protein kinase chain/domain
MDSPPGGVLGRMPGRRVLVVGDVMLDEYVWGGVRRVSQEAPVPVVELQKRTRVPGGAANAAANVAGLRGEVFLVGVAGDDEAGRHLRDALEAGGIASGGLLAVAGRPTTTKTRIIAHSQQVVRVDHELAGPLPAAAEERLLALIDERLPGVEACVLSDYAKGAVSPAVAQGLIVRAKALGKPVVVDPKGADYSKYRGATLVKPNLHEAGLFLRREVASAEDVAEAGLGLLVALGGDGVLITRGPAGMALFERGKEPVHIPAQAREVFDVTGAGDTVAGVVAMALAAGAGLEEAARLASRAAAIIVGRVGTAAVQFHDLLTTAEE